MSLFFGHLISEFSETTLTNAKHPDATATLPMTNILRILLLVFGPAPIAGVTLATLAQILKPLGPESFFGLIALYSFYGTFLCLIPATVATILMEIQYARGLDPRSAKSIASTTTLGACAGLALATLGGLNFETLAFTLPLGTWVGFVLGLLVPPPPRPAPLVVSAN